MISERTRQRKRNKAMINRKSEQGSQTYPDVMADVRKNRLTSRIQLSNVEQSQRSMDDSTQAEQHNIVENAEGNAEVTSNAANTNDSKEVVKRRSILRQRLADTRCGRSNETDEQNNYGRRISVGKWANNVFATRRSSTLNSATDSEPRRRRSSFWTRLAKNNDVWSDEDGAQELNQGQLSCQLIWNHLISELEISWKNKWKTVTKHPYIPLATLVCLAVLLSISIITIVQLNNDFRTKKFLQVNDLALDTGRWFSDQLNQVVAPLFTLREFVKEMPIFHDLPHLIGQGGEPGSAPYLNGTVIKFRNVTGICDNTTVGAAFDRISKSIRDNSSAKGAILALNIGPQDVACYFYPLNNTEDFTPPLYFDNSGAIGLDLLKDPTRTAVMVKTHQSDGFTVAGPMPLTQCASCPPAVRVGFIARLPVNMPGYNIYAGGMNYTSWGFVAAVLNWDRLLQQSDFQKRFEEDYGLQFELSKTDRILNTSTNQFYEKFSVLAQSSKAHSIDPQFYYNVTLPDDGALIGWSMAIALEDGFDAPWYRPLLSISVILSVVLSLLLLSILVEKQQHKNLLQEILPAKALNSLQKSGMFVQEFPLVTIFFSDIIGFTSMSAEMQPIQVMKMLNSFYTEADKLAIKNKVYKIKTIGDAYMCVGGCPDKCSAVEGAERVAMFALDMIELAKRFRTDDGSEICIRAGIHSDAVVAGVIEKKRPQYTLFGDAVNVASSMESTSEKMKIQCSHVTAHLLKKGPSNHKFSLLKKGDMILGQGCFTTYFIDRALE